MLLTAAPGTDATICATVLAMFRWSSSWVKTVEGRIASSADVGSRTDVTTTPGKGMAATSISAPAGSPGRTSMATAAYPRRSMRSRCGPTSGTAMRNDPSPCVTDLPPVLAIVAIAPARGVPVSADRTIPVTCRVVSAACRSTWGEPAAGAGACAKVIARRRRRTGTGKRPDMPDARMGVSCGARRGRTAGRGASGLGCGQCFRAGPSAWAVMITDNH